MADGRRCGFCATTLSRSDVKGLCPYCLMMLAIGDGRSSSNPEARASDVAIVPGARVGAYEIVELAGRGGMGEVYRARDSRLERDVALKLLLSEVGRDAAGLRRFEQEARTASSLNHPNILTIYEIGDMAGIPFIVTELIDGDALRAQMTGEPMDLRQVLDVAEQVASALAVAHEAGVVHCDIKPENIMVRRDGLVKVLDFGLATRVRWDAAAAASTPGGMATVIGTVPYMSPEQTLSRDLDHRSDLFSVGAVLFEMATGRSPFAATNSVETLHRILNEQPPDLRQFNGAVPQLLEHAIHKCLEKERDRRYDSARHLLADLRRARAALDEQSGATESSAPSTAISRFRRARPSLAAVAALAALAVAGMSIVAAIRHFAAPPSGEFVQLTNFADSATWPTVSPDGHMLTFIRGESTTGPGQVYVKRLPDGEPVRLTNDDRHKQSPEFSPDGARIAYGSLDPLTGWSTWVVPVRGGSPRRLLPNASGLSWIDLGVGQARLLFSELTGRGHQMAIVSSTERRTEHRTVYMPFGSGMAHRSSLSPDRKQMLVVEMGFNGAWLPCRLTPFDGTSPGKPIGPEGAPCTDAAWSRDGEWMYFSADTGGGFHIWRQRVADGTLEQVTSGVTEEAGIAFAPDGRSFVTSIGSRQSTVWVRVGGGDRQITSEGYAFLPSISPDGTRLYYLVGARGARTSMSGELWVADLLSGQRRRLLPDFLMQHYSISADGQRVVFVGAEKSGRSAVWVAPLVGPSVPRWVAGHDPSSASFGAGDDVIFVGEDDGSKVIYRVEEDRNELAKIVRTSTSSSFAVSPDGKWVVAVPDPTDDMVHAVMLYPIDGGLPTLVCRSCPGASHVVRHLERTGPSPSTLSWSPDGKFVYVNLGGPVYAIPLRPGQVIPPLPSSGLRTALDLAALPGARLIPEQGAFVGPNPSVYAFTRVAVQHNIYRVPVP